jgi:REP element-mobilizing transposase RayT
MISKKRGTKKMPRISRQLSKTNVYHVVVRGNQRSRIFLDDEDREKYIDIICKINKEKAFFVYAYCLMDNHAHLLINEGRDQITKIMQRIGVSYAYYFNKKYDRVGHLFQDRFRSQAIESEKYLLAALRYIHNNPVKAHMVESPAQFPWSSYNAYIDKQNYHVVDRETVLFMFSNDEEQAVRIFVEFSNKLEDDEFLDIHEEPGTNKIILNETDARLYIAEFMTKQNLTGVLIDLMERKELRNELIQNLKACSTLSIREIAEVLGIDRNVVQRVK